MKRVVVMSGVSGSGKSTYARALVDALPDDMSGAVVSADDHFIGIDGVYRFDPKGLGEAHALCFRRFLSAMSPYGGFPPHDFVVVYNTSTTSDEISPYMLGATAFGYIADIITIDVMATDIGSCAERNAHGVPLGVVASQAHRIASRQLPKHWNHIVVPFNR